MPLIKHLEALCRKIVIGYYLFVNDFFYRARYLLSEARPLIGIICFLSVPVFAILAYRAWSKTLRAQLSPWRNKAAVTYRQSSHANPSQFDYDDAAQDLALASYRKGLR